jgi:6-phospho-3-hexuloisomerase
MKNHYSIILREAASVLSNVRPAETEAFINALVKHRKIFIAGAGRTGLVARCFAMRLAQMGLRAYVVGETVTPPVKKGDVLVACSRSGETISVLETARRAEKVGVTVAAISESRGNPMARKATLRVILPPVAGTLPGGTQFETALLVYFDAVTLELMKKLRITGTRIMKRHANLE